MLERIGVAARRRRAGAAPGRGPGVRWFLALALLAFALSALGTADAKEKSSSFTVDIPAGEWKVARFRGLAGQGTLSVDVVASGPIDILLFDNAAYHRFPAIEEPLFRGHTEDKFGFSMIVPESGDYYLVLDNRLGTHPRRSTVQVTAATPGEGAGVQRPHDLESVNAMLAAIAQTLKTVFIVESLQLSTASCDGHANEPRPNGAVVICLEYAERLLKGAPDKSRASAALMFTLFHDIAAALLAQEARPPGREPDRADELATVLMKMFNQDRKARLQAEYFVALANAPARARELSNDPENPMSARRARDVLRWLDDPRLVRRWQPSLVPLMQSEYLEHLLASPTPWTVPSLVARELDARRGQERPI